MPQEVEPSNRETAQIAETIDELVYSDQPAEQFWRGLLENFSRLSGARQAVILFQRPPETNWRRVVDWADDERTKTTLNLALLNETANTLVQTAETPHIRKLENSYVGALRLHLASAEELCVIALIFRGLRRPEIMEALDRLQLVASSPRHYQLQQSLHRARADVECFAKVLDVSAQVSAEDRFLATAIALCNSIATSLGCERVSLGWHERGYIRIKAISRMEKFNRKMAAAQSLETAMDEAYDQDEEILWPQPEDGTVIARDHEKFARHEESEHVLSLPLRVDDQPVAVVTCERVARAFSDTEIKQIRLACDLSAPRLADLRKHDRWFGARWAGRLQELCSKVVGPEHTWAKVLAAFIVLLLAIFIFVKVDYRVEGKFILRSDEVVFLTAPFEGYLQEVDKEAGDFVKKDERLLRFDTEELELQEASEAANLNAYQREMERARAVGQFADMRIAEAQAKRAEATLELVRFDLEHAEVRTPFDGMIIEGDLREMRGTRLQQGDPLFKIAQNENLYIEAEVEEESIHEILDSKRGEFAFVSRPDRKFPMTITAIEPAGISKPDGNVFLVRARMEGSKETWWRPGMSGVCKIDVGKRTLLWIFTHKTADFLRMFFWW